MDIVNRSLTIIIFFFSMGILFQCNSPSQSSSDTASVQLLLSTADTPENVNSISGELTRSGFDSIIREFTIAGDSATANFGEIAVGAWHLSVTAYSGSMEPLYEGETDVYITGGALNVVHLTMEPTTGTLQVVVTWGGGDGSNSGEFIYMYTPYNSPEGRDIYRYSLQTGDLIQITHGLNAAYPSKLSNNHIGFMTRNPDQYRSADPAGNNQEILFSLPEPHFNSPQYNSFTNSLFFYTYNFYSTRNLAVIDLSGENYSLLTENNFSDGGPYPNTTGDSLLFHSNRSGVRNIFLMDLSSNEATQVTNHENTTNLPQWSKFSNGFYYVLRNEQTANSMVLYKNFETSNIDTIFNPTDIYFLNFCLSPDESKIAVDGSTIENIGIQRNLFIYDRTTGIYTQKTFTDMTLQTPRWYAFD